MNSPSLPRALLCLIPLGLAVGCSVGPDYVRPATEAPVGYEEGASVPSGIAWKPAVPGEAIVRGRWWEIYQDPALNRLEEKVSISNQNVLVYAAQYRAARAAVAVAHSAGLPTVSASPSVTQVHGRGGTVNTDPNTGISTTSGGYTSSSQTDLDLPLNAAWTIDIWGAVRRSVEQSGATAQAAFADLENARLSYQSDLAQDYFSLHGLDAQKDLLRRTVESYRKYLDLTRNRYNSGISSRGDVAQAETQLQNAQAQEIDTEVQRAAYTHAIAVLTGRAPAGFVMPELPLAVHPPAVPLDVPSTLLERRPDIAGAERRVAAANAAIGVAVAAFYPSLTLNATAGYESFQLAQLFSGPSFFWSVGPTLAQTLFDGGLRHAQAEEARANYDATVATYRQTVLTAFQQVEDNLAALAILERESRVQDEAVHSAETSLAVATDQYKAGIVDYLNVIVAQETALTDELTAITIQTRRMTASVLLVQALGGGWKASAIPSLKKVGDAPASQDRRDANGAMEYEPKPAKAKPQTN